MQSISDFLNRLLSTDVTTLTWVQMAWAILIAYAGGVLSSLTPCVYPMIPITVGVVGGLGHHEPHRKAWPIVWIRAIFYLTGMTLIYSFLGVVAGLTGRVFGSITNTSGWYLGLGIIMSVAALMMMEVITFDPIQLWGRLKHKIQKKGHKREGPQASHLGAFFLGITSGFIAAPCTTPVLTSILAYIAKTQSVGWGLALMMAFSLGLGTLLFIVATFTGALQVLPRSGAWLKTIKLGSGIILLGFAEYLIFRAGFLGGV